MMLVIDIEPRYMTFLCLLALVKDCVLQTVNALHYLKENHGVIHRGMQLYTCVRHLLHVKQSLLIY